MYFKYFGGEGLVLFFDTGLLCVAVLDMALTENLPASASPVCVPLQQNLKNLIQLLKMSTFFRVWVFDVCAVHAHVQAYCLCRPGEGVSCFGTGVIQLWTVAWVLGTEHGSSMRVASTNVLSHYSSTLKHVYIFKVTHTYIKSRTIQSATQTDTTSK